MRGAFTLSVRQGIAKWSARAKNVVFSLASNYFKTMKSYLSVYSATTYEKVIERSRFIANCAHAESEEEAKAFIAKVRAEHSLATHNCYAFVADTVGNLMRFSDDGEPQGTAGIPILDVLKNKKLFQTAVVVTRYFGGIKLGAGGLVRAYSGTAAEALAAAELREYKVCRELFCTVGYENFDALKKFLTSGGADVKDIAYADKITVAVAVEENDAKAFSSALSDFMAGRIVLREGKSYWFPFPIKN